MNHQPSPAHSLLIEILDAHWVMHVAWTGPRREGPAHCTPLYYARLQAGKECAGLGPRLLFASDPASEHGRRLQVESEVGASIALESEDISRLRGASLRGEVRRAATLSAAWKARVQQDYLARHPQAAPFLSSGKSEFYLLAIRWAKLTDNRRAFGEHPVVDYPPISWGSPPLG